MQKRMKKYVDLLLLELDDLVDDINMLISDYENRRQNKEITNYVLLENLAVLRNELGGVNSFHDVLSKMNLENYDTVDDFIDNVEMRFKHRIEECGLAEAIFTMVDRKLKKVRKYVIQD